MNITINKETFEQLNLRTEIHNLISEKLEELSELEKNIPNQVPNFTEILLFEDILKYAATNNKVVLSQLIPPMFYEVLEKRLIKQGYVIR